MRTTLTGKEIETYRDNGFVVVENFLDADELELWRSALEVALSRRADRKLPDRASVGTLDDDESYYDSVFTQRLNLWVDNPEIADLIINRDIGRMACELEDIDGIRVWHDQALVKPPWGNPTAWHLDTPFWSFHDRHAISIWVALDDATLQNGCLYFLPNTHLETSYENPGITEQMDSLFKFYPQFRDRAPVAAPMKAGSCSFHNGLLAHAAGANMTPYARRAMTCAFMPDGMMFNGIQNILSDAQVSELKVGDPLNDDKQNPLLYQKEL